MLKKSESCVRADTKVIMYASCRFLFLTLLCLLSASWHAGAYCPHNRNIISCCASAKATYSNGRVVKWTCSQCDDGYKRSSNGQQCIQDKTQQCGRGKGRDYYGNCTPCSDENCDTCSQLWTFCNSCKSGYVTDSNGECIPYNPCGNREGLDYNGNCVSCVDDNCRDCSDLWTQCNRCDNGYGVSGDECVPLLQG